MLEELRGNLDCQDGARKCPAVIMMHKVLGELDAASIIATQEELGIADFNVECKQCPLQN
ncbi:MAG: hypothetical protein ABSB83_04890 [Methanomassiliicoccales archaeon]|jgi:hypothetical protein